MFLTVFLKICSHWKAYAKDWNHSTHCTWSLLHFSTMIYSPWNALFSHFLCFHHALCAFTVHSFCALHSTLIALTVKFTKRSSCAHCMCIHKAFILHLPFIQRLLIIQSVLIYYHSEFQSKRIGLCESQQNENRTHA